MIMCRPCIAVASCAVMAFATAARAGETVATYLLTWEATWSVETHPVDFPPNPHFSGLIGGTHDVGVRFWELGGMASSGMESMSETGSKTLLTEEVNDAIATGHAERVLSGGNINPSPGVRTFQFDIPSTHPLATLVSMIAPSPDWFIGVDSLRLAEGGVWLEEVVVELHPYDTGTDSGVSYRSNNDDTDPQEPIRDLSNEFPFTGTPPLGTFTFTLISVSGCAADFNDDGSVNTLDVLAFLNAWNAGDPAADINADGSINTQDVLAFLNLWSTGCD